MMMNTPIYGGPESDVPDGIPEIIGVASAGVHARHETFLDKKIDFQENIDSFSSTTIELKSTLDEGKKALLDLKTSDKVSDGLEIASAKWVDSKEKTKTVISELNKISSEAEKLFSSAEEHVKTIQDDKLKNEASGRIAKNKEFFTKRFQTLQEKLASFSKLHAKIDDTLKYLEIVQQKKDIQEKITDIVTQIDTESESFTNETKTFSETSKGIFDKAPEDISK
ncbi:MAG: hypothetical protein HQM09_14525 [Candidatus Riflebacteria bacterium]|nr:hypothetical protein [Candidatus Riflebacteria bacterium]